MFSSRSKTVSAPTPGIFWPPTRPAPVILFFHGNAGNISHRLDLAALLLEAGAGVLLLDYRGYGSSDGKPGEENTYRDAQAAYHWLADKGVPATNIVAYGESLGGGVACELAAREKVGGLVLQSTFTSLTDLGGEIFPWLPVRLISTIKVYIRAPNYRNCACPCSSCTA